MASRVYQIAFEIAGKIAASFPKSLTGASSQLQKVGKQIADIEKAQGTVTAFHDLHKQIEATGAKLRAVEAEKRKLDQQMRSAPSPALGGLAHQYDAAANKSAKLRAELQLQLHQLQQTKTAMAAAGVATASLGADTDRLAAKMAKARAEEAKIKGDQAARAAAKDKLEAARSKYSEAKGKTLWAAAGVGAFAVPAAMAAQFEDSMVRAGALAQANDQEYAKLAAQARQLGRDTRFSGIQAAEGMQFLAQAGLKTQQILDAMPGMLQIAASGQVSIGEAADVTTSVMAGFSMQARDAGKVGDVLANAFTNSKTTLASLGETFKYIGPKAREAGMSLEQTAAAAAALGNSGIQGGEAGTALRAIMSRIAAPRAEGQKALARLGLRTKDLRDAHGNMLAIDQVFTKIGGKLEKFGSADRIGLAKALFGEEAATAGTVLVTRAMSGELQRLTEIMGKQGTAAKIAEKQNATMAGQWDSFKGSVEEVGVSIGYALIPTLKRLIDQVVPVINKITQWMSDNPELTETIVKVGASVAVLNLFLAGGGAAGQGLIVAVQSAKLAMSGFQLASAALTPELLAILAPIGLLLAAIGLLVAAGYLWAKNWDEITDGFKMGWNSVRNTVADTVDYIKKIDLAEEGKRLIKSLADGILSWGDLPTQAVAKVVSKLKGVFTDKKAEEDERIVAYLKGKVRFTDQQSYLPADITSNANAGRYDYSSQPAPSLADRAANMSPVNMSGGDVTVHYSPKIEISGASAPEARSAAEKATSEGHRDLEKKMKELLAQGRRLALE